MDKYELLEQIGEGAYGTVHKAREKVRQNRWDGTLVTLGIPSNPSMMTLIRRA